MKPNNHELDQLYEVLAALAEDSLEAAQKSWLNELLTRSAEARLVYRKSMYSLALLERFPIGDDAETPVVDVYDIEPISSRNGEPVRPNHTRWSRFRERIREPVPVSLAFSALILLAIVGALSLITLNDPDGENETLRPGQSIVVATLGDLHMTQWSHPRSAITVGSAIFTGQRISIRSGFAELHYRNGAKVVLQGPVDFVVDESNGGTLESGRILGEVSPAAQGFTVRTAAANIVDLGTQFGLEVRNAGETYVNVFQGSVRIESTWGAPPKTLIVQEGEAALAVATGKELKPINAEAQGFVKQLPQREYVLGDWMDGHFARIPGNQNLEPDTSQPGDVDLSRIGSGGAQGGNKRIVAAYFFPLPRLTGSGRLSASQMRFHLLASRPDTFSVDLYGLPGRNEALLQNEEFYVGPADDRYPKIVSEVLRPDMPPQEIVVNNDSLTSYLSNLYNSDGSPKFKYAAFRFNPHEDPGDGFDGYAISMRENTASNIVKPYLILETTHELASPQRPSPSSASQRKGES